MCSRASATSLSLPAADAAAGCEDDDAVALLGDGSPSIIPRAFGSRNKQVGWAASGGYVAANLRGVSGADREAVAEEYGSCIYQNAAFSSGCIGATSAQNCVIA